MTIVITPQTATLPNGFVHTGDAAGDVFVPTDQADTFIGGGGIDRVSYAAATEAIRIVLTGVAYSHSTGAAVGDQFVGISELEGSAFNDTLYTGDDGATLFGAGGNDSLRGRSGDDVIYGGSGDDALRAYLGGSDSLFGGAGNDIIEFWDDGSFIGHGDDGDDVITVYGTGLATLYGGAGEDALLSEADNSVIHGGAGADFVTLRGLDGTVYGGEASDLIIGGNGDDALFGGDGGDVLHGREGNDLLVGGMWSDFLYGEGGNDTLIGGIGTDVMNGGEGNDVYYVHDSADGADSFFEDFLREDLPFSAGGGIDTIFALNPVVLPVNFEILRLVGSAGYGTGNDGDNTLVGTEHDEYLVGRGGDDKIVGGAGIDRITGNSGADMLVGGEGNDTFIYTSIADSRAGAGNRDFINGFEHYVDVIDLRQIDANTCDGAAVNDAWTWIGSDAFDGTWGQSAGQLRYMTLGEHNAVIVEGDHNGDGRADFQIFVNGTDFMSVRDFLL